LIEKYPTFDKRGSTFGLAKNGQLAISELSSECLDYMQRIGMKAGETLVFIWYEFRDALLRCVKERSNIIKIHCGEEFTSIIDNGDDGVCVVCHSGLELTGDFVVGADGVHSKVRDALQLPPPIQSENTLFRGSLTVSSENASSELKDCLGKGIVPLAVDERGKVYFTLFNFNEKYPNRLAWVLSTNVSLEYQEDERVSPIFTLINEYITDEKKAQLIKEVFNLSDPNHLEPYPKTSVIDMSDDTLDLYEGRWGGSGRITLIGDASHGMRPTDGYGGSMAMEDAVVLTRILRGGIRNSVPVEEMLERFEKERLPRVKKVYDNQESRYNRRMKDGVRPGPQSEEFMNWLLSGV